MAFTTKLSLSLGLGLSRSPPLGRRCIGMAEGVACLPNAVASPPLLPQPAPRPLNLQCGSIVVVDEEKRGFPLTSLSLSLSLGPNSPRKHYGLIHELSTTATHSNQTTSVVISPEVVFEKNDEEISTTFPNNVVSQEEVVSKKIIDEEITSFDSRSCFQLFGIWLEKKRNVNLDEKKNAGIDDGLFRILEDSWKPLKKRESILCNVEKKRKRAGDDQEELNKPLKKRGRAVSVNNELFKMRKILTKSDVNQSARLLLGNKVMIDKLLVSNLNLSADQDCFIQGKEINVYDLDTKKETTLYLKRWMTNSFILNHGWSDKFIRARNLQKGDEIELEWDQTSKRLNFSVVKRALGAAAAAEA